MNAGPAVIDDQEVPKKLLRLMKEKETWTELEAKRKEMKALKKKSKEEGDSDLLDSTKSAMYVEYQFLCVGSQSSIT